MTIKIIEDQELCKCGHKKCDHNSWGTECYVNKKIKGSHYQCTCRKFIEVKEV